MSLWLTCGVLKSILWQRKGICDQVVLVVVTVVSHPQELSWLRPMALLKGRAHTTGTKGSSTHHHIANGHSHVLVGNGTGEQSLWSQSQFVLTSGSIPFLLWLLAMAIVIGGASCCKECGWWSSGGIC